MAATCMATMASPFKHLMGTPQASIAIWQIFSARW